MVTKTHGQASADQVLTGSAQYYTVWCSSTNAFTDPDNATGVNIRITDNIQDESQKNFEVLVQSIGLRVMPIILNNPIAVAALENNDAPTLTGEGFVWKFAAEYRNAFVTESSSVGLLVEELNGIVLPNGTILNTAGGGLNIEFSRQDELC